MLSGSFRRLLLVVVVMNGSISLGENTADSSTGIEGLVTVSPARPGPIRRGAEIPNAVPLPNAVFSVANEKGTVTSFTTDANGRFRLTLSPGQYRVSLAENRFPKPCGPFEIEVAPGRMTKVEWRCDSGMR